MYDAGKIIAGIIIFVALITAPIWIGLARGDADDGQFEPVIPTELEGQTCIFDNEDGYMRETHMDILNDWRDLIVRGNIPTNADVSSALKYIDGNYFTRPVHIVTNADGSETEYDISLTNTCIDRCHTNKDTFCDSCHIYSGVLKEGSEISGPNCWDCHYDTLTLEQTSENN